MYGKYTQFNRVEIKFNLKNDIELGTAYIFFDAGVRAIAPHMGNDVTLLKLQGLVGALKRDILLHNERIIICNRYNICTKCGGEIDLQQNRHEPDTDYPEMGLFRHKTCPPRRNIYEKDL